jgi:hypothetical protein
MEKNKVLRALVIVSAVMWLGVSAAIVAAVMITGKLSVFWWYLIPFMTCVCLWCEFRDKGGGL